MSVVVNKTERIVNIQVNKAYGKDGKSLEYDIQGNTIGVRQEGEVNFTYTPDLKGAPGSDATVTKENVEAVLPNTELSQDFNRILESEYYNDLNTNAEVVLSQSYFIEDDGDYIEWIGRNNEAPNFTGQSIRSLYLFGERDSYDNTLGYFAHEGQNEIIRFREDGGNYIELDSGLVNFQEFKKIRIQKNGTNWDYYIDDNLELTAPCQTGTFIINNIGRAGRNDDFADVSIKNLKLKAKGVDVELLDFTKINGAVNVEYVKNTFVKNEKCYYSIEMTASPSGNELISVYTKLKEDIYVKTYISHMVNETDNIVNKIRPQTNLWRHYGAYLVRKTGSKWNDLNINLVFSSENEFTYYVIGDADHTGGWHGYEKLIRANFFADGLPVSLENKTNVPCSSFKYGQLSEMYKYGDINIIAAEHSKQTDLSKPGYATINEVFFKGTYNLYTYAGITCIGKGTGTSFYTENFDIKDSSTGTGAIETIKTGGSSNLNSFNSSTKISSKLKGDVDSLILNGVESEVQYNETCKTGVWDRATDTKYYRKTESFNVVNGDYYKNSFEMIIE